MSLTLIIIGTTGLCIAAAVIANGALVFGGVLAAASSGVLLSGVLLDADT